MKRRKKKNLCTKITIFCFVISLICIGIWIALFKANSIFVSGTTAASEVDEWDFKDEPKKENLSVLFAGVDKDGLRTDSIIYAKYDTVNNVLYMMSIPRDTYTTNPLATNKINSIYYGGKHTKEFVEEIENKLDVKIDYYAIIDLKMVSQVVKKLGGLKINLDNEIWKLNKKTGKWYFVLPKGEQTLNAKQVETLVRNRDYADGDLSREKMQRKVIMALISNIMSKENVLKIPSIAKIAIENTNTNVSLREVMKYVDELKEIDMDNVISTSMPIEQISYKVNGMDCVIINEKEAKRIIKEDWIYTPPVETEDNLQDEVLNEKNN